MARRRVPCAICGLVTLSVGDLCETCAQCEAAQTADALAYVQQNDPAGYSRWHLARMRAGSIWVSPDGKRRDWYALAAVGVDFWTADDVGFVP